MVLWLMERLIYATIHQQVGFLVLNIVSMKAANQEYSTNWKGM
jgi:hypothetical protein